MARSTAHLTPKELDLLRYLTQHANEAVPHRALLQAVWGPDYGDQVDYLRVFIKNLREEGRAQPGTPAVHHHGALGGLSLQRYAGEFVNPTTLPCRIARKRPFCKKSLSCREQTP